VLVFGVDNFEMSQAGRIDSGCWVVQSLVGGFHDNFVQVVGTHLVG